MHITNAKKSKRKWFYWVFLALFILPFLNNPQEIDMQKIVQHSGGELPFLTYNLLGFVFLTGILLIVIKYIHNQSFTSLVTGRSKFDYNRFWFAFLVWGGITIFSVWVDYLLSPEDFKWNFQLIPFLILAFISILLIPIQTGFEEFLFRGYFLQGLGIICKNRWLPLILTSVTFGLMHIANPEVSKFGYGFISLYIIMGFFMGIMVLMDNGLELAWGMHTANNVFSALLVSADWTAFQTPSILKQINSPNFDYTFILMILFYQIVLLYIFAKKYNWTHWKEKLFGKIVIQ